MIKPEKSKIILLIFVMVWFVISWFFIYFPYSQVNNLFQNAPNYINDNLTNRFPNDLIINIKSGQVSTNKFSPFCLTISEKDQTGIVFDTESLTPPNVKEIEENGRYSNLCKPIAIVGKEYILYPDKDSGYRISKIDSKINYIIDKPTITKFINQLLPRLFSFGKKVYFIGPFIAGLLAYLYFLLINIWYASVAKFFTKILKIKTSITPNKIFNLTLFFYTIILAIDWIIFGYLIKTVMGFTNINVSFFMRNTMIITLLAIYYQNSHPLNNSPKLNKNQPISIPTGQ